LYEFQLLLSNFASLLRKFAHIFLNLLIFALQREVVHNTTYIKLVTLMFNAFSFFGGGSVIKTRGRSWTCQQPAIVPISCKQGCKAAVREVCPAPQPRKLFSNGSSPRALELFSNGSSSVTAFFQLWFWLRAYDVNTWFDPRVKLTKNLLKNVQHGPSSLLLCFMNMLMLQSKKEQPILLKILYICERFGFQLVPFWTLECYGNFHVTLL